jgi:hypothetical protein
MSLGDIWSRKGYRSSFSVAWLLVELLQIFLRRSTGCVLSFLTLLSVGAAPLHAGGFITAPSYDVGLGPTPAAVGDFNGDGILDLVVADAMANGVWGAVSIILGNSDGTFRPARSIAIGFSMTAVTVGDFNGDGKLDLALATIGSSPPGVTILLGKGNGTFGYPQFFAAGSNPSAVVVGDFNGDGIPDLAVANNILSAPGMISILLGNGDGTFQAPQEYAVGSAPQSVAVGDFNGDSIPDLAVANELSETVSILLGKGDGTFQAAQNYGAGIGSASVTVGDFNGDGRLDLAVADSGTYPSVANSRVSILLGNGDGTFQAAQS